MTIVVKDRVKTTTSTSGTGALVLSGTPEAGFQSFSVIGDNQTYYCVKDGTNDAWEVGIGTVSSSGTALSRDTILSSSNSDNVITLTSGSHSIFTTYPAGKSSFSDLGLNLPYQVSGDTVSSGDPVALNSNGTVSKIKETTSYNKTNYQWESATDYQRGWAFDPETNTAVLMFNDSNNGSYPTVVAGTIDPTNGVVTWGTPAVLKTDSNGIPRQTLCFMENSSQTAYPEFLAIIRPTSQYEYYKSGWFHVNGTTITMGQNGNMSWYNFSNSNPVGNGGSCSVVYDSSRNYFCCAYQYGHYGAGMQLYAGFMQITSSGFSTPGYGTFQSIGYQLSSNNAFKLVYDKNLQCPLIVWSDANNSNKLRFGRMDYNWTGTYSMNYAADISGSSATAGLVVSATYDPITTKTLVLWAMTGSPYTTKGVLITYSGNTGQTSKSTDNWNGADDKYTSQKWGDQSNGFYQASSGKTYYGFLDPQDNNIWKVLTIDTSGTNLAYTKYEAAPAGSYTLNASNQVPYYVKPESSNYDFFMFTTTTNSESYTGLSVTTTNSGDYFGLAISGAANGSNIDVNLFGSINSSQTGLTSGSNYYVSDTGTLGLTGGAFVGTALSATSIQITSPPTGSRNEVAGENLNTGTAVGFGHDGKVYKARNFPTGNVSTGDVSSYATINTDFSDSYNAGGSDGCWDEENGIYHILYNDGNGYCKHVYATPDGNGWTYSTPQTFYSSNVGGVAIEKGKSGNGNPMFVVIITTTNTSWQYGSFTYDGTTLNTWTTQQAFANINASKWSNKSGQGTSPKIMWSETFKGTVSNTYAHGAFLFLGCYNGLYYESGGASFRTVYYNGVSEYGLYGSADVSLGNWQQSGYLNAKSGNDMVFSDNTYDISGSVYGFVYIAMRRDGGYSGVYGVQKLRNEINSTRDFTDCGGFQANNQGDNISTGIGLALNEVDKANSRLYLMVTPNNKITCQVVNPTFDTTSSTNNMGNPVDLITDTSGAMGDNRPVMVVYNEAEEKLLCAYGTHDSTTDQRVYHGLLTTSSTSPYISVSGAFTEYYSSCSNETAGTTLSKQIKPKGNDGDYIIMEATTSSSKGNGKASLINFSLQKNNAFNSYIGIAQSTVLTNDVVTLKTQGATDSNQSGLTVGDGVLIDSATGDISSGSSTSATKKQIGVAPTSTKIILQ